MRVDIVKNSYGWFIKYHGGGIAGPFSTIRLAIEDIYETNAERYISAESGYVLTTADKLEILKVLDFYNSTLKAKTADQIVDVNFSVMDYINKDDKVETAAYFTKYFCIRALRKIVRDKRTCIDTEVIEFEL